MKHSAYVTQHQEGQRLDKALDVLFPHLSLRARRELWHKGNILVDGKIRPCGYAVIHGQHIEFVPHAVDAIAKSTCEERVDAPFIIDAKGPWTFIYKPSGMPSVAVRAKTHEKDSLEAYMATLFAHHDTVPLLCNRLDTQTSGIIIAAHNAAYVQKWRAMEAAGLCRKRYVALVQKNSQLATMPTAYRATHALDTHKRKITRITDEHAPAIRHTSFMTLGQVHHEHYLKLMQHPSLRFVHKDTAPSEKYFMGCIIQQGARHQIRAHAAHAGFALCHDTRYSLRQVPKGAHAQEFFVLHHGMLEFPDAHIYCPPAWKENVQEPMITALETFFSVEC